MKNLLVFFSGEGIALDQIAKSCFEEGGKLHNVASMTYAISDQRDPPGFVIAKKWGLVCISVPFCEKVADTWDDWNRRIIGNSFWPPKPDLVILANFFPRIELPPTYKVLAVKDSDDPVVYCQTIHDLLVDTTMPR